MGRACLEREVLLELTELLNLRLDLCLAPILNQLIWSEHALLALALPFCIVFGSRLWYRR